MKIETLKERAHSRREMRVLAIYLYLWRTIRPKSFPEGAMHRKKTNMIGSTRRLNNVIRGSDSLRIICSGLMRGTRTMVWWHQRNKGILPLGGLNSGFGP